MTEVSGLGFLLVGTGAIAGRHAEAIQATPGCHLVAVASRQIERATAVAERFGVAALSDAEQAAARHDVGAYAVCTEHDRHVEWIERAARHRKHVLVEKPLAVEVAAAAAALRRCREAEVLTACVFQRRFDPLLDALRQELLCGQLGAPIAIEASMAWRRDARYFETSSWRGDPQKAGGGVLMMQAIHFLDAMRYLLGEVESVQGQITSARGRAGVEVTATVGLRFRSGALASVFATTAARRRLPDRFAFHFENGSLVVEGDRVRARTSGSKVPRRDRPGAALRRWLARRRGPPPRGTFLDVYRDFVDAVRSGHPPRSPGADALKSVALVQAIYQAAAEGRTIQLSDPL